MSNSVTRIEHFGHTVFHIRAEGHGILVDPMLARAPGTFRVAETADWFVPGKGQVDAVVISHAHDDHLHPPTLLALDPCVPVFAFGDACVAKLRALGMRVVRPLVEGAKVTVTPGVRVTAIPAEPSVEGTKQCALLFETPDATVLDAVDIHDAPGTREALAAYRSRIDAAFLPAGASLQWQGAHNQMDPIDAAAFAAWLDPTIVCPCGGVVSASADRRLGTLERYPYDRGAWLAASARELSPDRLCALPVPMALELSDHRVVSRSTTTAVRSKSSRADMKVQALVACFFTGYHPTAPTRRIMLGWEHVPEVVQQWHPLREVIAMATGQLEVLVERCELSQCRTPASTWLPTTVRHLLRREQWQLASQVIATLPTPTEDEHQLVARMVSRVEAAMRRALSGDLLADALVCLGFDHDMSSLHAEHQQLRQLSRMPAALATAARAAHVARLRDRAATRRPRLSPNHILVDAKDVPLVSESPMAETSGPMLCVASPEGVQRIILDDLQRLILERCDGRSIADISRDLGRSLGADFPNLEHAVFEALARLSTYSIQLLDWSLV